MTRRYRRHPTLPARPRPDRPRSRKSASGDEANPLYASSRPSSSRKPTVKVVSAGTPSAHRLAPGGQDDERRVGPSAERSHGRGLVQHLGAAELHHVVLGLTCARFSAWASAWRLSSATVVVGSTARTPDPTIGHHHPDGEALATAVTRLLPRFREEAWRGSGRAPDQKRAWTHAPGSCLRHPPTRAARSPLHPDRAAPGTPAFLLHEGRGVRHPFREEPLRALEYSLGGSVTVAECVMLGKIGAARTPQS